MQSNHAVCVTFGLIIMLLMFVGCDHTTEPTPINELRPLAVGNYWRYISWNISPDLTDTLIVEIINELPLGYNGTNFDAFVETGYFVNSEPASWLWIYDNASDGLYFFGGVSPTDTLIVKELWRKYPGQAGESWLVSLMIYRSLTTFKFEIADTQKVDLIATNEPFETPLGNLRCYVYRYPYPVSDDVFPEWDAFEYYAPGIGLVGMVVKSRLDGRLLGQRVLYDYRVN